MSHGHKPETIDFNRPHVTGDEFVNMSTAIREAHTASSGPFSALCADWLTQSTGARRALLTHSCTAALEMAFTLADVGTGDEVIMPSFTFVSTANAVVARGGRPIFVDIRPDTLCIDEMQVERAVTSRTKAIVPVHYAGVGCEMDVISRIARSGDFLVIEDAAQGVGATYVGRPLGGIGHFGAYSFHETKNVSCGEGGALLINDDRFVDRAEIVLEKGTDRRRFSRGEVAKYTWVDVGSSYALSDLAAAYLWAQLEHEGEITAARRRVWERYHAAFESLEREERLRRPIVPSDRVHNAHMYYLLLENETTRTKFIAHLAARGIHAVFHYVPLHSSIGGRRYATSIGALPVTVDASARLVRLPMWADMTPEQVDRVAEAVADFFARPHAGARSRARSVREAVGL